MFSGAKTEQHDCAVEGFLTFVGMPQYTSKQRYKACNDCSRLSYDERGDTLQPFPAGRKPNKMYNSSLYTSTQHKLATYTQVTSYSRLPQ